MSRILLQLKYTFNCNPGDLFFALHNPQTMQNWLAEKVTFNSRTKIYTFHWSDTQESARIIEKDDKLGYIKWEWIDGDDHLPGEYVSYRLGEPDDDWYLDLYIDDFCEEAEVDSQKEGWNRLMERLELAHR